jgi:hypothetical protein
MGILNSPNLWFIAVVAWPEPEFVNLLRSPGIDSHPGGPLRQPLLMYRAAWPHRLEESISWNRFLGSLNVYKYGHGIDPRDGELIRRN